MILAQMSCLYVDLTMRSIPYAYGALRQFEKELEITVELTEWLSQTLGIQKYMDNLLWHEQGYVRKESAKR